MDFEVTESGFQGCLTAKQSIEEDLNAMAKNLALYCSRYFYSSSADIGIVDAIGKDYYACVDWADKVKSLYNKILNMKTVN